MNSLVLGLFVLTASLPTFAYNFPESTDATAETEISEEDSIQHEVMLACVASKAECSSRARAEGVRPLRTVRDAARCPNRARPLACVVWH